MAGGAVCSEASVAFVIHHIFFRCPLHRGAAAEDAAELERTMKDLKTPELDQRLDELVQVLDFCTQYPCTCAATPWHRIAVLRMHRF